MPSPHTFVMYRQCTAKALQCWALTRVILMGAGLRELVIDVVGGGADVLLSCKWAALKQLLYLELSGLRELRQELGPCEGALHSLFLHLEQLEVEVRQGLVQSGCCLFAYWSTAYQTAGTASLIFARWLELPSYYFALPRSITWCYLVTRRCPAPARPAFPGCRT